MGKAMIVAAWTSYPVELEAVCLALFVLLLMAAAAAVVRIRRGGASSRNWVELPGTIGTLILVIATFSYLLGMDQGVTIRVYYGADNAMILRTRSFLTAGCLAAAIGLLLSWGLAWYEGVVRGSDREGEE